VGVRGLGVGLVEVVVVVVVVAVVDGAPGGTLTESAKRTGGGIWGEYESSPVSKRGFDMLLRGLWGNWEVAGVSDDHRGRSRGDNNKKDTRMNYSCQI
jgi:hypothetical protein